MAEALKPVGEPLQAPPPALRCLLPSHGLQQPPGIAEPNRLQGSGQLQFTQEGHAWEGMPGRPSVSFSFNLEKVVTFLFLKIYVHLYAPFTEGQPGERGSPSPVKGLRK